jgi:hypothetical protein
MDPRNHGAEPRDARIRVVGPPGWAVEPAEATTVVPGRGGTAPIAVTLTAPASAVPGRVVVMADLELAGDPRGQVAQWLLEVAPS